MGDEELTADGDTAEGGSSGYPSEEENKQGDEESDEDSDEDDPKAKRSRDDSSSVKSIRIFPKRTQIPSVDDGLSGGGDPGGGGSYDDVSVITSSVY
jgi:hypothetical protein